MSRIIPACAGKRRRHGRNAPKPRDHPRLRGEKMLPMIVLAVSGSSPLARGKAGRLSRRLYNLRIIPACAGKSRAGTRAGA